MTPGIKTVFLDAGGVLAFPNWARISDTLARHGVHVTAVALAAAEPYAKKQLDQSRTINVTNDEGRGWLYFNLIFERAGVAPNDVTAAALTELYAYHQHANLWEHMPDECQRHGRSARRAPGDHRVRGLCARFIHREGGKTGSTILRDRSGP